MAGTMGLPPPADPQARVIFALFLAHSGFWVASAARFLLTPPRLSDLLCARPPSVHGQCSEDWKETRWLFVKGDRL
jgi:hypothetical protein